MVVLTRVGVTLLDVIPALLLLAWQRRGQARAVARVGDKAVG